MLGYTLAQFHGYLDAAAERERAALRNQLHVAAAAAAGGDVLRAALKAVEET